MEQRVDSDGSLDRNEAKVPGGEDVLRDHGGTSQEIALKTLLVTDMVDSTKLVLELGDARSAEIFARGFGPGTGS